MKIVKPAMRLAIMFLSMGAIASAQPIGTWLLGPPLPTARSEVSVTSIGTQIYVIGGYAPIDFSKAFSYPMQLDTSGKVDVDQSLVQVFDVATQRWSNRASLPRGMNHIGVTSFNDHVYTFGGFIGQNRNPVSDAYVYDPQADRWSAIAPLPRPLGSVSVTVLGSEFHLVGGRDVHSVRDHFIYDPVTNSYRTAAPLPIGRDHMGLVAYGGKIYAIGGRIDDFNHNTSYLDIYDPHTDSWTAGTPMPSQRSGMAVEVLYNRIFAIGGERGGGTFTNNEVYDPRTDHWYTYAPLPEGRHGTGAAVIGHDLYIPAGGPVNGGSRQSNTLYIFTFLMRIDALPKQNKEVR
ncbi:MAG: galactose oxidase [Candidatus Eremiobacteraeota bacterium]|nr:galactose oxidase [Candidatus Eremiobacteraeota bacterium]